MNVKDAIINRYSVRSYLPEPVTDEELSVILDAARMSQSAKNLQDWCFIVVRDKSMKKKLSIAAKGQNFIAEAPVLIACCGVGTGYIMSCGQHSYPIDVAIAMENMVLVAHEMGIGTCWIGAFYEDQVKNLLSIPKEGVRIVSMLTLGRPAGIAPVKKRKVIEAIVRYEKWT